MVEEQRAVLTLRQRQVLLRVIEEYVTTGQPVGSKTLVHRAELDVSSSTIRNELALLEEEGFLTHPHTSAGRVPTDRGYRYYVDGLLERLRPLSAAVELDLPELRNEIDAALRTTTEALSELTHLLALVSAPPLEATVVRHVEVLRLQPEVVMVVMITTAGDVTKRLFSFSGPVDLGLAEWARQYLNERVAGLQLGTRLLRARFEDPELGRREREFLATLRPVFTELVESGQRELYVGGTADLLDEFAGKQLQVYKRLLELLEERAAMLALIRQGAASRQLFARVGSEFADPALHGVSLVGASYGLRNRELGTVSLVGPTRMDYAKAIDAVRWAAHELSHFVEELYE